MLKQLLMGALLTVGLGAVQASAATVAAIGIDVGDTNFTGPDACSPDRCDAENALGSPDGTMYELGRGGELVVDFGQVVTGPITIYEITNGDPNNWIEGVRVYAILQSVETLVGEVFNNDQNVVGGVLTLSYSNWFDGLRLVDITPSGTRGNGADIDAITASAVPLPAAAWLFISALAGAGLMRRKARVTA